MSSPLSLFVAKEDFYPETSSATNTTGACNRARLSGLGAGDKVQLTGGGFRTLQQFSAAALREVRARGWGRMIRNLHAGRVCGGQVGTRAAQVCVPPSSPPLPTPPSAGGAGAARAGWHVCGR